MLLIADYFTLQPSDFNDQIFIYMDNYLIKVEDT